MEGNPLKQEENRSLEDVVSSAEALIVISLEGDTMLVSFSDNLSEMEVLDHLSEAASAFWHNAKEEPSNGNFH